MIQTPMGARAFCFSEKGGKGLAWTPFGPEGQDAAGGVEIYFGPFLKADLFRDRFGDANSKAVAPFSDDACHRDASVYTLYISVRPGSQISDL